MKILSALILVFFILFIGLPMTSQAETNSFLMVDGVIGDCALQARKFEINGKIYTLPDRLPIENTNGKLLTYKSLKSGTRIQIYGKKHLDSEKAKDESASLNVLHIDGEAAPLSPHKIIVVSSSREITSPNISIEKESSEITFKNGVWRN